MQTFVSPGTDPLIDPCLEKYHDHPVKLATFSTILFSAVFPPPDPRESISHGFERTNFVDPEITQVEDRGTVLKCPWGYRLGDDNNCVGKSIIIFINSLESYGTTED